MTRRAKIFIISISVAILTMLSVVIFSVVTQRNKQHQRAMDKIAQLEQVVQQSYAAMDLSNLRASKAPMSMYDEFHELVKSPIRTKYDEKRLIELSVFLREYLNDTEMSVLWKGQLNTQILDKLRNAQKKLVEELGEYTDKVKQAGESFKQLGKDKDIEDDPIAKAEFNRIADEFSRKAKLSSLQIPIQN
jgi:uncharacterized protein YlxW (UPF0749 family)